MRPGALRRPSITEILRTPTLSGEADPQVLFPCGKLADGGGVCVGGFLIKLGTSYGKLGSWEVDIFTLLHRTGAEWLENDISKPFIL